MRVIVQRVSQAKVIVDNSIVGQVAYGFMILLGIGTNDTLKDADYLIDKVINLRVFEDVSGKMNLSLKDINGELLIVSQFTLYGDCRRGTRPSFSDAAPASTAENLYKYFIKGCIDKGIKNVRSGSFGAHMVLDSINDGPVTILIDSEKAF